jgi:hypothetical protein
MLDYYTTSEMYKTANAFEQERYQRAISMLEKCGQTGLIKISFSELSKTLIFNSRKNKYTVSIHTVNAQLHIRKPENAQLLGCSRRERELHGHDKPQHRARVN